jgi:catechol 2,3-dioxygenase-like lactoylglutathione lyase family enzyme
MRLDHVLLAVGDLEAARRDFRERLGMNALVGGVHPGRGTHNSLVHLGTAYLELIGVNEPGEPRAQRLLEFLKDGDGPETFALAVDDLDAALEALRRRGLEHWPSSDGSRRTPEGTLLRWRSAGLRLDGDAADVPLPFLIEWADDAAGQGWFRGRVDLARHDLPWGAVHAILIASQTPRALADQYVRLFGWRGHGPASEEQVVLEMPGGGAVNRSLGPAPLVVLLAPPAGPGSAAQLVDRAARARLDRAGDGFLGLAIRVGDLDATVDGLRRRGVGVEAADGGAWAAVEPADAHGMLIELVAAR